MDREDDDKDRTVGGETGWRFSPPSSLRADSSLYSYPTHLEISMSETDVLEVSPMPPPPPPPPLTNYEQLQPANARCIMGTDNGAFKSQKTQPTSFSTSGKITGPAPHTKFDDPMMSPSTPAETCQKDYFEAPTKTTTSHPTTVSNCKLEVQPEPALVASAPMKKTSSQLAKLPETKQEPSMVEEDFFSFVILHAPEDMDMACRLKEKLEAIDVGVGATFTEDFAVPGRNALMCVEDAINNSAYTILLLTRNFNTRMLEVETSSALINSIEKRHKYNTVIPLWPQENCMPPERMPLVLRILSPLREDTRFDKMAKKAITKRSVEKQRLVWVKEQRVRQLAKRQEEQRLMSQLDNDMDSIRTRSQAEMLELGRARWYQPSIHISNAQNIIIGNNCQMTVGESGDSLGEEDVYDEEDQ